MGNAVLVVFYFLVYEPTFAIMEKIPMPSRIVCEIGIGIELEKAESYYLQGEYKILFGQEVVAYDAQCMGY